MQVHVFLSLICTFLYGPNFNVICLEGDLSTFLATTTVGADSMQIHYAKHKNLCYLIWILWVEKQENNV